MGDFDEKVGMEIIKDSMGLTDEDLAPESDMDLGDESDEGMDSDGSDEGPQREDRTYDSHEDGEPVRQRVPERQQKQERPQKQDPLRQNALKFDPRATFKQDQKGNLIDAKTGEIIARAGSEARIYQRVHKQASDYLRSVSGNVQNTLQAERGKLERAIEIGLGFESELSQLKNTFNQINAHQLDRSELLEAAGLFRQAKTDPVGVLKNLLTRAALGGIDISQLGMDGGSFDAKSLVSELRKEMQATVKPVVDFTAQQRERAEGQETESRYLRQAETQVNQFFGTHKEAVPYTHIFHSVLSQPRFQNMSLGEIWDKVQLHLIRNGIDPRQPPSRNQRQRLSGTPDARPVPSRSPPNGQGMAPVGGDRVGGRSNAGPAHPSMSYDAIIREILGTGTRKAV